MTKNEFRNTIFHHVTINGKLFRIFVGFDRHRFHRLFLKYCFSCFFEKKLPTPPGGYGGVVFMSTSDLDWKNVNYFTMKTVNIGSNFSGEKGSLKYLILQYIPI